MTLRAVLLGIFLGLIVPIVEIINSSVVRQKIYLLGNQLPLAVFGVIVLLLLVWNPLAGRFLKRWVLQPAEIAIIAALGLTVCAWPGSNFMRSFETGLALPSHLLKSKLNWQSAHVMSYMPGGSPLLAEGFIRDWPSLVRKLTEGGKAGNSDPAHYIWQYLPPHIQKLLLENADSDSFGAAERTRVITSLNDVISDWKFYDPAAFAGLQLPPEAQPIIHAHATRKLTERENQTLNRLIFNAIFTKEIRPGPKAEGVLLANGEPDPVAVDVLIQGSSKWLGLSDLPWRTWWPTLKQWGGFALLISIGALCLALIVHPQWSKRELLPYPIARFVNELTEPSPRGGWPQVAYSKLFWFGLIAILVIHATNGLNSWYPQMVKIPLQFDFDALRQLSPGTAKVDMSSSMFKPILYPAVIAFAFFLGTEVSFSLGILGFLWLIMAGVLISQGIPIASEGLKPGKFQMITFGGYLSFTVMLLYVGRRYYWNVVTTIFGMRRYEETPSYATWAARGLVICAAGAIGLLIRAGLDWPLSILLVGLVFVIFFVLSRIYAETGVLMAQCGWGPLTMLLAVMGPEALGPTSTIVMGIACLIVLSDARETWMAYFVNALQITRTTGNTPSRKVAPLFLLMLLAGFAVTLGAGFLMQYNKGINVTDRWAVEWVPGGPFDATSAVINDLSARDQLVPATEVAGLDRFREIAAAPGAGWWILAGAVLVAGCYFARLRLPWWPIHPILFLLLGTWAAVALSVSFLIGWMIKASVVNVAGAKAYHTVKALMVGIIAGEILAAIFWGIIGAVYYFNTGLVPLSPVIFP